MAGIKGLAIHLPENIVYNEAIEERVSFGVEKLEKGTLKKLLGIHQRHFADSNIQVSDLATEAGRIVMSEFPDTKIDLLIFAAASSDLIEPATANIIQFKLGLQCPVMDIKNACNSFVSAIQVASAFIDSEVYQNILIVNGEKLSEVINYSPRNVAHLIDCIAGYGLGDAGAAMIVSKDGKHKLEFQRFKTWGEYWRLCRVEGGGSLAYREFDKYYFEGDGRELRNAVMKHGPDFVSACLMDAGWKVKDIDCVITHQVSAATSGQIAAALEMEQDKCINTFHKYGNTAAATIPMAIKDAVASGKLFSGNRLMIIGFGAGLSISVQLISW